MRSTRGGIVLVAAAALLEVAAATPLGIELPPETATLRRADLPGYAIALGKCAICHSADYIALQPPHLSLAKWTAEVTKMQHAYGAPLEDAEIQPIAIYLTYAYGDATSLPAAAN